MRRHGVASCNCNTTWDRLLSVPTKICPVKLMEPVLFDGRMFWIKTQFPLLMCLKISEDME